MSFLVDKLRVSGFRGIPGWIDLDLSSPLTVIYAPNGTGKTSICRSLQWLISEGQDDYARCEFSKESVKTHVTVRLGEGGKDVIRRSYDEGSRTVNNASVLHGDLLKRLAPECNVSNEPPKAVNNRLMGFIRSTRFLSGETLAGLIDDSEEARQARESAFADITDTSDILELHRKLESYSTELQRAKSQQTSVADRVEKELNSISPTAGASSDSASLWLQRARQQFNDSSDPLDDPKEELSRLNSVSSLAISKFVGREMALHRLAGYFIDGVPPQQREAILRGKRDETQSSLLQQRGIRDTLLKEQSNLNVRLKSASQNEVLLLSLKTAFDRLFSGREPHASATSIAESLHSRVGVRWDDPHGAEATFERIRPSISQWPSLSQSVVEIETEMEAIRQSPDMASLDELRSKRDEIEAQVRDIDSELQQLSSLSSQLQVTATAWIEINSTTSDCPTCGYHWPSAAELAYAIERAAEHSPVAARLLAAERQKLSDSKSEIDGQIKRTDELNEKLRSLNARRAQIVDRLEVLQKEAAPFGFHAPIEVTDAALTEVQRDLRSAQDLREVRRLADRLGSEFSVMQLSADRALIVVQSWIDATRSDREALEHSSNEKRIALDAAQAAATKLEVLLADVQRELGIALSEVQSATALATSLGLAESPTWKEVSGMLQEIGPARLKLDAAGASLKAAAVVLDNIVSLQRRAALQGELAKLRKWSSEISEELSSVSLLRSQLSEIARTRRGASFGPLLEAINELFGRMQANVVVENLSISSGDRSFLIEGYSGDVSLSPQHHFSQGQRQDLALAMFLVRAYSLGGTFFLDEPLSHLDDLNRVALLDTLRAFVLEASTQSKATRLVITTSSWSLARHFVEKFLRIDKTTEKSVLRVYQLSGNARSAVKADQIFPIPNPPAGVEPTPDQTPQVH